MSDFHSQVDILFHSTCVWVCISILNNLSFLLFGQKEIVSPSYPVLAQKFLITNAPLSTAWKWFDTSEEKASPLFLPMTGNKKHFSREGHVGSGGDGPG